MIFLAGFIAGVAVTNGVDNLTAAAATIVVVAGGFLSSRYN